MSVNEPTQDEFPSANEASTATGDPTEAINIVNLTPLQAKVADILTPRAVDDEGTDQEYFDWKEWKWEHDENRSYGLVLDAMGITSPASKDEKSRLISLPDSELQEVVVGNLKAKCAERLQRIQENSDNYKAEMVDEINWEYDVLFILEVFNITLDWCSTEIQKIIAHSWSQEINYNIEKLWLFDQSVFFEKFASKHENSSPDLYPIDSTHKLIILEHLQWKLKDAQKVDSEWWEQSRQELENLISRIES